MPKNIVCADGTGNKFCNNNTNVVRLYSGLDLSDSARQVEYYDGGLDAMGAPGALSRSAPCRLARQSGHDADADARNGYG
jgi:uncharacterized protein (DUF2235 family)